MEPQSKGAGPGGPGPPGNEGGRPAGFNTYDTETRFSHSFFSLLEGGEGPKPAVCVRLGHERRGSPLGAGGARELGSVDRRRQRPRCVLS